MKYIKSNSVKELCHSLGRRVKPEFLEAIDRTIDYRVRQACQTKNGGGKTLDMEIAAFVGFKF